MTQLTIVNDSDAWLDVRVGDTCIIKGKLKSIFPGGVFDKQPKIMIQFADWTNLVVDCASFPKGLNMQGKQVNVCARRTEDGLSVVAIWVDGGPPVPL